MKNVVKYLCNEHFIRPNKLNKIYEIETLYNIELWFISTQSSSRTNTKVEENILSQRGDSISGTFANKISRNHKKS